MPCMPSVLWAMVAVVGACAVLKITSGPPSPFQSVAIRPSKAIQTMQTSLAPHADEIPLLSSSLPILPQTLDHHTAPVKYPSISTENRNPWSAAVLWILGLCMPLIGRWFYERFCQEARNASYHATMLSTTVTDIMKSPEEALHLWKNEGYILLDTRSEMELNDGRIRHSSQRTVEIPMVHARASYDPVLDLRTVHQEVNLLWLEQVQTQIPRDAKLIVMCSDGGNRTMQALTILASEGYRDVIGMAGGFNKWDQLFDREQWPRSLAQRAARASSLVDPLEWPTWHASTSGRLLSMSLPHAEELISPSAEEALHIPPPLNAAHELLTPGLPLSIVPMPTPVPSSAAPAVSIAPTTSATPVTSPTATTPAAPAISSQAPKEIPGAYLETHRLRQRVVFDMKRWRTHRSETRFVRHMFSVTNSSVFKAALLSLVLPISLFSAFICWAQLSYPEYLFELPTWFFSVLAPSLGLLLVFRTNATYERWDGARKMIGLVKNRSEDITRQICTRFPPDRPELRDQMLRYLQTYFFALKVHLRSGPGGFEDDRDLIWDVRPILKPKELDTLLAAPNRPAHCLQCMTEIARAADLEEYALLSLDQNLIVLADVLGGCERILRTPIPLSYGRITSRFLFMWLLLLPLAISGEIMQTGQSVWFTVPAVAFAALLLIGIEEVSIQTEEPFTILPMETYAEGSLKNTTGLYEQMTKIFHGPK